jgi:hypothetical protein
MYGNNFSNFDQGSMFGRVLPPLNGEFKLLGEFGGSFVSGATGRGNIGNRGFGSSGSLDGGSNLSSDRGLSSNSECSLFADFGSSI